MTSPSHTPANSFSNSSTWAARFSGLALPSSFFTFFHVSFARRKTRRMLLRPASRPKVWNTHCLSFFSVQPWPGRPCSAGRLVSTTSAICWDCRAGQKGGAAAGAAVGQGVGAVLVVAMDPAEDGLVLPADVGGAGGGVEPPGGDQVQRLEALAAPPVRRVHRGEAQVFRGSGPTWPSRRGPSDDSRTATGWGRAKLRVGEFLGGGHFGGDFALMLPRAICGNP